MDADDDRYLPDHVYANWLLLAARVAADAPDRDAWRRWAAEHIAPRHRAPQPAEPPARGAIRARSIGRMVDAEPPAAGAIHARQRSR